MTRHLLPLLLVIALPAPALADAQAEAKEHIAKATELHGEGRFADALLELNTAYTLDPQPDLLYAIGQINVKLGDCKQAVLFYKRYLKTKPEKRAAAATKEAIKTCKSHPPPPAPPPPATTEPSVTTEPPSTATEPTPPAGTDEPPAHADEPPAPPVVDETPPLPPSSPTGPIDDGPERHRGWYTDVVADVLLGGGLVAGGVGAFFYTSARSDLDAADDAPDYDAHKDLVDKAHNKRLYAIGLAGAGVALVGAGIIRLMVHDRTEHRRVVGVAPSQGGGMVVLEGSF